MVMSGEVRSPHHDRVTYSKFQLTSETPYCKFYSLNSLNLTKELQKNSNGLFIASNEKAIENQYSKCWYVFEIFTTSKPGKFVRSDRYKI